MNVPISQEIYIDPEELLYETSQNEIRPSDPYVYPNGILINRFGIQDYEQLALVEKEFLGHKVITTELVESENLDYWLLKRIHAYIFNELFDWAGEFRTVPLVKAEKLFIPGLSIDYSPPSKIKREVCHILNELNAIRWGNQSLDEISELFATKIAQLWRVHPFRDGNTRAIMGYAKIYAYERGFPMNMSYFTEILTAPKDENGMQIGLSLRDMFVAACLDEFPEPQHLIAQFKKAILAYSLDENDKI